MRGRAPIPFIAACLAPALTLYGIFVLIPAVNAFRYSLTRWDGLSEPVWVGLQNFKSIFRSGDIFLGALYHNIYLMAVPGVIILVLALFFAYTLHRGLMGGRLFRITFFFPNVISFVAISLLWILIYSPTKAGLLNNVLKSVFHYHQSIPFTQSSRLLTALPPMIVWSAT